MNSKHSNSLGMVLSVALAVIGSPATLADTAADPPASRVRYGDLDLAREDGIQTLYSRVRAAARRVCEVGVSRDVVLQAQSRRCAENAVENAVARLGNPRVSALHAAGGRQPATPRIAAVGR